MATSAPRLCITPRTDISPTLIEAVPSVFLAPVFASVPVPRRFRNGSRRPAASYEKASGVAGAAWGASAGPDAATGAGGFALWADAAARVEKTIAIVAARRMT